MAILVGLLTISLTLLFSTATVVPTPQSIGSDLSIITHNDLYGNLTTRHAASILLSTSFNYSVATSKCAALGTKLWDPQRHLEDLTFLRYLDYANAAYKAGVYWVSSNSTTNCTAVTAHAELAYYPCETYLPVLCFNAGNDRDRQVAIATNNARIIGLRERSSSSFRFLGITYASIPARFAHSTYYPPPPGSNITALDYSPQCIQSGCGVQGTPDCAEDCLTLNIWTPHLPNVDNATRKGKAVMVWIHGGGFTGGAASDTTFDGNAMASRGDVVLVTINYRLSTLGFLALSNTSLTGNYGLHDQSVALDWLRAHVEDFGGDKDRITVFGQSAGAASVRALLASPQARNKVCGAIMMSTPQGVEYASTFSGYLTIEEATNRTAAAIAEVGCTPLKGEDTVACLRKADPLALVGIRNVSQPSGTVARYPVVDGIFLTNATLPLGPTAPRFNIPIMSGIMRDDGSPFTSYPTWSNVSAVLSSQGFPASAILSSNSFPFPEGANSTLRIFNLTSRVATDVMFRCLAQSTAYTAAKNGVFKSVYSYEFDRAYQIEDWSPNPPACEAPVTEVYPFGDPNAPFYKCHSGELLSVFGNTIPQGRPLRDDDDIPFSQFIVDTWTAFARTGNPTPDEAFLMARGFTNTSKMVKTTGIWEPVNAAKPMLKVLDVRGRGKMEEFREGAQCEVLGQRLDYYDS